MSSNLLRKPWRILPWESISFLHSAANRIEVRPAMHSPFDQAVSVCLDLAMRSGLLEMPEIGGNAS